MKRFCRILTFLTTLLAASCSVTRNLPEGSVLLAKVTVDIDKEVRRKERLTAEDFQPYIRQLPNKRLLGTNFYAWFYSKADPEKENWWNRVKRRIGQQPVLLDMELTRKTRDNFEVYMHQRGFYSSHADFEIDTVRHRKARITYRVRQGRPTRIASLGYDFRDRFLEPIIGADTVHSLIRPGEIFDIDVLRSERERITEELATRGYYNFSVNDIEFTADTLRHDYTADLTLVVKQSPTAVDAEGRTVAENNVIYKYDRVSVYTDYDPAVARDDSTLLRQLDTLRYRGLDIIYRGARPNIRPKVLRQSIALYPNHTYDARAVSRTYNDLVSLSYFKGTRIDFSPVADTTRRTTLLTYVGEPHADTLDTPLRADHTREGLLRCDIRCTPAFRQSVKIDLEGSMTSTFYGLSATTAYQNRNIFRGADVLDVAFTLGYEYMRAPDARKKTAKEFAVTASLTIPRLLLPFGLGRFNSLRQPRTKFELSLNFQDRPYYRRTLTGGSWGYAWAHHCSSFTFRPVDITLVDVSYLNEDFAASLQNQYLINSYRSQLIAGLAFGYGYNNQSRTRQSNASFTQLRINVETAGNLVGGLAHLFGKPVPGENYYNIFNIRYAQYFRVDINASRKIRLGAKTALAGRIFAGVGFAYGNTISLPLDKLFYVGGSNSMRGWTPRTLGPGSVPEPKDQLYPSQLGDMRLETNLELRFPIWGIVNGATFLDAGNIWFIRSNAAEYAPEAVFRVKDFYKQLGFNTGLGIRIDIKFAILRLDWGLQLHNPNLPHSRRWLRTFHWSRTALNFGVGYPF